MAGTDPTQLYLRHTTRHRGITYRVKANGDRVYSVRWENTRVSKRPDGTTLTTEKAALDFQAELRQRSGKGEKVVVNSKVTFSELADVWFEAKARNARKATKDSYQQGLRLVLIPRFAKWKLGQIGPDDIALLIRELETRGLNAIDPSRPERALSANSIHNYLKPLSGTLDLAVRRGLIPNNPAKLLTRDERPRSNKEKERPWEPQESEITSLIEASAQINASRPRNRGRDYTPINRLGAFLGLRIGEILALRWQDFEKDGGDSGLLHIRHSLQRDGELGPPKTRAGKRTLPITPEIRDELIALKLASGYSQESDFIFAGKDGRPLDYRSVYRYGWEVARDKAGLPEHLVFHDLRHAAASRLIAANLDVVTVAAFLGHDDPSVTLRVYAHLFDKQDKHAAILRALAGGVS